MDIFSQNAVLFDGRVEMFNANSYRLKGRFSDWARNACLPYLYSS